MTLGETEGFARLLRTKQAELSRSLENRDEIVIEAASDVLDQVQLKRDREIAIQNLDRNSNILRQIRGAFSRIDKGDYGVCLHCEEDISPRRLTAVPWAGFCIGCQEKIDHGEITPEFNIEELASAA
jgi:DnaK suppressor protein